MKLKNMWKRFWTLDVHNHEGFTLVELIIVIAILAILSTGAIAGYSAYVEKANKTADQALISEIKNVLLMAYYADTNVGDMVVSVVLTDGEAEAAENNEFVVKALNDTYGANWTARLKLKYNSWGNGVAVSKEVIDYFINNNNPALDVIFNGEADISYTDSIPELFELMEDTAIMVAGKREDLGSGANMVSNAAGLTMGLEANQFSQLWASSAWDSSYLMDGAIYDGNAGSLSTTEQVNNAIANAAVIKARNVALATYLSDLGYSNVADSISNYTFADSVVPNDAAACFVGGGNLADLGLSFSSTEEEDAVYNAICDYYGMDYDTLEVTDITKTQSYTDGLAYYAMMSTVNELKNSENLDQSNDETWWNDLYNAVDMYASIANGSVTVADLNEMYSSIDAGENTVLIMLTVVNGEPEVKAYPLDANS